MWMRRIYCRACGFAKPTGPPGIKAAPSGEKLIPVFSLGLQPLSNAFAKDDELQSAFYPLEVLLCPRCSLSQLSCTVPAEILYRNYAYVTSKSDTMQAHFEALWKAIKLECDPNCMCEVGSNDGDMLAFARMQGAIVCGIDPAENLADEASKRGLQTFRGVLDASIAGMVQSSMPPLNLILARHVFCHVDDWHGFVRSLGAMSNKDTIIAIEVPYVMDLLKNVEFDTIYFEHTSYLSLKAMKALLEDSPFQMHKVLRFPIHGGAIVIMLRHKQSGIAPDESVAQMLAAEHVTEEDWRVFSWATHAKIEELRALVLELKAAGKTVAGYGASAKATVWLNALKFTRKEIAFVCDSTPQKQWRCVPGTDIPVVDPGALTRERPDYAICWAWNFFPEIEAKETIFKQSGGHWIVPVPKLEIV